MEPRLLAGRYELHEQLGDSSWRATDGELGREVLVRLGADADVPAATLSHPSIVRVFDQGEADGERYAVLEYLPGGSLAARGELTDDAAVDVAAALAYAHGQGVAHGSLGADSILFDGEGRAKVAGFGARGDPAADVHAFGGLLRTYGSEALAPVAAAALAAGIDAGELLERIHAATPTPEPPTEPIQAPTLIRPAPVTASRRGRAVLVLATLVLAAAGIAAAFLAASDDAKAPPATSLSLEVPTAPSETVEETEAPPPEPTTTEQTTTEKPTTQTKPRVTAPPPTTIELPPTSVELPPTEPPPIEEPVPPTTEELPGPPTDPGNMRPS